MPAPWNAPPPLAFRLFAGLLGLLLGLSTLLCCLGLLSIFGLGEDLEGGSGTLFVVVAVCTPMVLVLAGATSALFVFAFTGRRGPLIHQGSLRVLIVVVGTGLSVVLVGSLLAGDWFAALRLLGIGVELAGLFFLGSAFETRRRSREA